MKVRIQENYGVVQVSDAATNKNLPKTYVKCFSRDKTGKVSFYKDGYTDIIGRFDYSKLNINKIDQIEKFSILIVGPAGRGIVIKECGTPSTVGKFEEGVLLNKTWKKMQSEAERNLNLG